MKIRDFSTNLFFAAVVLCLLPQLSNAQTITQTFDIGPQLIFNGNGGPNFSEPIPAISATFNQFDPALGDLISFQVDIQIDIEGTLTAGLNNINGGSSTVFNSATISLGGFGYQFLSNGQTLTIPPGETGAIDVELSDSRLFPVPSPGEAFTFNPSILPEVLGTGTVDVGYSTDSLGIETGTYSANEDSMLDISYTENSKITLTYQFQPNAIPEPSSLVIGCLFLAGATGFNLRNRN